MLRRLVLFVSGIALLLAGVEIGARIVMSTSTVSIRWYDAAAQLKIEHLDDHDYEVVFAGTSMAAQGFDPSEFTEATGRSAYNASLAGGTPEVMDRWLLEEVVPRANPDLVVWGLSALDLAPSYGTENGATYDNALATRDGFLASIEQALASKSTIVSERVVLRDPGEIWGFGEADRRQQIDTAAAETDGDGQRIVFTDDYSDERGRVMAARLAGFSPSGSDIDTIIATIRELQKRGIEVVIVELPVPDRFLALYPAGSVGHESVGITLSGIANLTRVQLVRLDEGFSDSDFVDFTHLDQAAASSLTARFAEAYETGRNDRRPGVIGPATTDGAGAVSCETEEVVDEYGALIEVCIAGPDGPEPSGSGDGALEPRAVLDEILARVLEDCGQVTRPDGIDNDALLEFAPDLGGILDAAALGRDCGAVADPVALASLTGSLHEYVGGDGSTAGPADVVGPAELAAALDEFAAALEIPGYFSIFWTRSEELGLAMHLQAARASGEPISAIAAGSSQASWAIDQTLLDGYFGGAFLNVGHPGFDEEEWELLWPRLLVPEELDVVIWATSTHRLINDSGTDRCLSLSWFPTDVYRDQLGELFGVGSVTSAMLVGEDGSAPAYRGSTLLAEYDARYESAGDRRIAPSRFLEVSADEVNGRYFEPAFCAERVERLVEILQQSMDAGAEVVLVSLPVHAAVTALAPEAHALASRELARAADTLGIELVEFAPLGDDETQDGIHTDLDGRARISNRLLEVLDELGFD